MPKTSRKRSKLEARFAKFCSICPPPGILAYTEEFKFHPTRRWLFDFAWPDLKVAVEIQGGGFVRGKHGRGAGQQNDFDKLNEAQRLGWVVIQFGPTHLSSHRKCRQAVIYINQILKDRLDAQARNKHQPTRPTSTTTVLYPVSRGNKTRKDSPQQAGAVSRPRSGMV